MFDGWGQMKRLVIGMAAGAALLSLAAQPAMSKAPARQSPRIEMPDEPAADRAPATAPKRHRARPKRSTGATAGVDRAAANAFTHQLNRQVLESLGPGGAAPSRP